MRFFRELAYGAFLWGFLLVLALAMEGIALYYQHGLGEPPCVLCIHVRLIVLGIGVVALLELLWREHGAVRRFGELTLLGLSGLLAWRGWELLAIERGWRLGDCSMDLGLPAWLAVDRWLPWLFRAEVPCGYTPVLPGGFTMAEVLPALAGGLIFLSAAMLVADLAE